MIGVWATEEEAAEHAASRSGLIYFQAGPAKWCVDYAPTANGVECVAEVVDIKVRRAHHRAQKRGLWTTGRTRVVA